jgi:hypothetical protein
MIKNHRTLSDLWRQSVWRMWRGTIENGGIDFVASIDTIAYDNLLAAQSMEFDLDMGRDLWLNKQRWTRLVRQYLDRDEVERFIVHSDSILARESRRGVVTTMFCNNVTREAKKHRWGNCMLAFTFRGGKKSAPTLTLHSRVSYIAYIGGLDLALAHVLAREIGATQNVPVEDFQFRWHADALQFHGFKSLPLLYRRQFVEDLEQPKRIRAQYPTISLVGRWWDTIRRNEEEGKTLDQEKYGPLRRIRRRYQEYMREEFLPTVTVDDLDLSPLYR